MRHITTDYLLVLFSTNLIRYKKKKWAFSYAYLSTSLTTHPRVILRICAEKSNREKQHGEQFITASLST